MAIRRSKLIACGKPVTLAAGKLAAPEMAIDVDCRQRALYVNRPMRRQRRLADKTTDKRSADLCMSAVRTLFVCAATSARAIQFDPIRSDSICLVPFVRLP